jgi:hypothetical protein
VAFGVIDDMREALEVDGENIATFMIELFKVPRGMS